MKETARETAELCGVTELIAWDRAPYSWNMISLFSLGCHVIDRAYVRTRLQIVRAG